jgi:REP element-mobilizing transposase RayT
MNTFTNIYLHIIFCTKYRDAAIGEYWKSDLHAYIASVINANGHRAIIVGGVSDHIHILLLYNPKQSVSDLVRDVKIESTQWINKMHHTMCRFAWQKGYGVFSYSSSQMETVRRYISNQETHHANVDCINEFKSILKNRGMDFDKQFLPKEPE